MKNVSSDGSVYDLKISVGHLLRVEVKKMPFKSFVSMLIFIFSLMLLWVFCI
jgi:hypothetical protein